tara:strand:+ start:152 stop:1096 length:945 start_codon:yes stop_codon:yes gene_type:complete
MINKKIIIRISNELGNQMFMYASALGMANKLNINLIIDDESAYKSKKNISRYGLNNFNLSSLVASDSKKFLGIFGYLRRKILKKINPYIKNKVIFVEPKNAEKITRYNEEIYNLKLSKNVFVEGYFESEKYFSNIKDKINSEFKFLNEAKYQKSAYLNEIIESNSVSICLRQNRFIEGVNKDNELNKKKSVKFTNEQIEYINKSISYIKKNVQKSTFFIWSNNLTDLEDSAFDEKINKVIHDNEFTKNLDKRALDMYLISQCNHHIVIPSSFNWWGAWLSNKQNKIVCRPSNDFFTDFKINNLDFWPSNWKEIK